MRANEIKALMALPRREKRRKDSFEVLWTKEGVTVIYIEIHQNCFVVGNKKVCCSYTNSLRIICTSSFQMDTVHTHLIRYSRDEFLSVVPNVLHQCPSQARISCCVQSFDPDGSAWVREVYRYSLVVVKGF